MVEISIERVWARITAHEGETFQQKRGQPFVYNVAGNGISPSTTNHLIAQSQFEKALEFMPTDKTTPLQHLRGPSYLWAILMDQRIRRDDW